ncbi:PucR family transcriptional regulator ligand-binding domain-containing protein [Paenibacillus sp. LHD-117]|uniref:PucR family transcriptional regulator n=1 Tax=Paenibacillus sp. LHD-117 TaxID=3071412 RepID=UPI0027DF6161|nr:PucR family transcriptional regulator ligand-binding domain-containing protein [Paenibacillus sp. LHD-117]MDQ6419144.1 PucR family transcriptional regulator ligand-binding domain-containing protein [Paenibacillus sp. LHD-117]
MLLKDLLHIPSLKNARVAAGQEGLNRRVSTVNMMDAPDIIHYLKPDELLLTTAYAMKDQPESLDKLVAHMAESGCAGLAIKTKRFLEEIPESVIEEANRLEFPILELSLDYSLGEVLNGTLSRILENRTGELSYALDTHHTFFNLILNGEGISEIVDKLAELIASPVVILSSRAELISLSSAQKPPIPLLNQFIAQWQSFAQPVEAGVYPIGTAAGGTQYAMIQPIPTYQRQGYIIAFVKEKEENKLYSLALEQAANVMGFELLKSQAVKDRARRFKIEFFTELVQGEIATEQEIIHRGKQHGLYPADQMICVICGRDSDETEQEPAKDHGAVERKAREIDNLYHGLAKHYAKLSPESVLFTLKDKFIALIPSKELFGSAAEGKLKLGQQLLAIADKLTASQEHTLSFGISSPITKLADIPSAYKQALDAYRLGRSHNKQKFVQYYHTKELMDLLKLIPSDDLKEFVADTFEAWSGIDEGEQREWHRTLKVFYDTHCHIGETAKQLYIHRNTVLYRLNRIEQLTGAHVRNSADSLRIRMALMIKELIS